MIDTSLRIARCIAICLASTLTAQDESRAPVWVGTTDGVIRVFDLELTGKLTLHGVWNTKCNTDVYHQFQ